MTMWEMWLLRAVDELLITVTVHGEKVRKVSFVFVTWVSKKNFPLWDCYLKIIIWYSDYSSNLQQLCVGGKQVCVCVSVSWSNWFSTECLLMEHMDAVCFVCEHMICCLYSKKKRHKASFFSIFILCSCWLWSDLMLVELTELLRCQHNGQLSCLKATKPHT